MEYAPPQSAWPYVIGAAVLLIGFLIIGRRGGWPVLLVAVALQPVPDPQLVARLDTPTSSTVSWTADRRLCLSYNGAPDRCYAAGAWRIQFGHVGQLDGTMRPSANGVYQLTDPVTGASWRAVVRYLRWIAVWRA